MTRGSGHSCRCSGLGLRVLYKVEPLCLAGSVPDNGVVEGGTKRQLEDVAQLASEMQPTGTTFETANVKTKVPGRIHLTFAVVGT